MIDAETQKKLTQCLKSHSMTSRLLEFHKHEMVAFSSIENTDGQIQSYGSGNGEQSIHKSVFECLEHYHYRSSRPNYQTYKVKSIISQIEFNKDKILNLFNPSQMIDATEFTSLVSNQKILVPTNWIALGSEERTNKILFDHCSSSGYSFHINEACAIEHALLELIERHVYSHFLIDLFVDKENSAKKVSNEKFSEIQCIEHQYEGKILLIELNQFASVHTSLAIFYPTGNKKYIIPQVGAKSSYCKERSMLGAIAELKQILTLYSDEEKNEDLFFINKYSSNMHVSKILRLDGAEERLMPSQHQYNKKNTSAIPQNKKIIQLLNQMGYHALYRKIHEYKNGMCVVQVFIPGFEKFNLIRLGISVNTHKYGVLI